MRVKLKVARAGNTFSQRPGDVIDVDADEGQRMIAADQCTAVDEDGAEQPKKPEPAKKPKPAKKAKPAAGETENSETVADEGTAT